MEPKVKSRRLLAPSEPKKKIEKEENSKKNSDSKKLSVLYSWTSPERIWKPRTRAWYLSVAIVILIFIFLAARLGYWIIIIGLLAFMLLLFVQATIPPWDMDHKVTTKGIYTYYKFFRWDEIEFYWFGVKGGQDVLYLDPNISTKASRLSLLIDKGDRRKLFELLSQHIKYGNTSDIGYNFVADWLHGDYVPISEFILDKDQPDYAEELRKLD